MSRTCRCTTTIAGSSSHLVFSSHLFLFYFLPLSLLLYYAVAAAAEALRADGAQLCVLRLGEPAVRPAAVVLDADRLRRAACSSRHARANATSTRVQSDRRARRALIVSMCTNLTLLGFFKYFNFGVDNINALAHGDGSRVRCGIDTALRVTLPLGISFYTFQSMSYAIDVYRGDAPRPSAASSTSPASCRCSRSSSPVRSSASPKSPTSCARARTPSRSSRAASRSSRSGWRRKCCSPTRAARSPTWRSTPDRSTALDAWYGVTAYAFQIYFDFSGYSDMAIGLGLMLGFVFREELRLALSVAVDHRVLAALAHLAVDLAARLPLRPARRQSQGPGAHLRQPVHRHAARRAVARRVVELRRSGAACTARCSRSNACRARRRLYWRLPAPAARRDDVCRRALHVGLLPRRRSAARPGAIWRRCSASACAGRRGAARRHRLSAVLPAHVLAAALVTGPVRRRGTGRARSRRRKRSPRPSRSCSPRRC